MWNITNNDEVIHLFRINIKHIYTEYQSIAKHNRIPLHSLL